MLSALFWVYNK